VRWTLERTGVAAAIVGAFDAGHLDDNLRVFGFELDEEDLQRLAPFEDAGPDGDVYTAERVAGGRHAAIMKYNLNREASD
jgi:diketogulonate reductase-like aldo/keto reductase